MSEHEFTVREWMKMIPETEFRTYEKAGHRRVLPFGKHPALLVIDVTIGFCGSKPQPLDDAINEFSSACGEAAWEAIPKIQRLLRLFREEKYPVIFSRPHVGDQMYAGKATKSTRQIKPDDTRFNAFPDQIAPMPSEWILQKTKASTFFNTSLNSYLIKEQVDTLVICGVSTSGCVRASVVDAFSHGYLPFVVDECCFDRSYFAHCANLFDMDAKYSSVLSLDEIKHRLQQLQPMV